MKIKLFLLLLLISTLSIAQNGQRSIDQSIDALKSDKELGFFEVSKEMFQMLSESEVTTPELKSYYKELSKLKMLTNNSRRDSESTLDLYTDFLGQTNLKGFVRLMVSERSGNNLSFYKKRGSNDENQFLLISNRSVIYICGTIDLKSVHEFERIISIAGAAMGG